MHPSCLMPVSSNLRPIVVATLSLAAMAAQAMGAGANSFATAATGGYASAHCAPATGLAPRGRLAADSGCGAGAAYRTERQAWTGAPRGRMEPALAAAALAAPAAAAKVAATATPSLAPDRSQ